MTTPKPPFIRKRDIQRIVRELPARLAAAEKDRKDKRCLQGAYAPEPGRCRVCPGPVVAEVGFHRSDLLGGPPPQAFIRGWHCEDCGLVYAFCPPPRDP